MIRSSSIVKTLFNGLDVVSVMAAPSLAGLVAFSHLQVSQIRRRQPYLIVRNFLYVIRRRWSRAEKERIVAAALEPSAVARRWRGRQHISATGEGAQLPNLSRTTSIGHRNGNRRLVNIQPNVAYRMRLARLPCMRLCAGSPAQPSFLACRETGRFSVPREHTV